ncbi:hypothetical protein DQF64_12330 [Moraxella bovis]|nr:hypothetical protein DQF64_12330 [Moraxella bovis]
MGEVTDNISGAISGLFNNKPSQTQTSEQAPKPTQIKPVQTTEQNQRSQEGGTPKVVVSSKCATKPACITSGKSELIREINIRLAGFGGALPTDEFTEMTANCIKQFQRDYMKAPETGKICGSLLVALDKFNKEYPIASYTEKMPCPCGACDGYGKGRYNVASGENFANEYPGIHRSLIWMLKALEFYLTKDKEYKSRNLSVAYIFSGYRCIDNNKKNGRTSVNHMGLALDIHFNKKGSRTRELNDMEFVRKVMKEKMKALEIREDNRIYLEPKVFKSGKSGTTTWVHYDITMLDKKYIRKSDFKQTVSELVGKSLMDLAKSSEHSDLLSCSGMISKPSIGVKNEGGETLFLTEQDIIDIMKVTETEVIKFKDDRYFKDQAAGVVDTILNRTKSGYWGDSVRSVVNAHRQFSKITGPKKLKPYGSVENMPFSAVSERMRKFVGQYLIERSNGKPSIIGEHLNYANKYYSDDYNRKKWVDAFHDEAVKNGLILGFGKSIHAHGTVKELIIHKPKPFIIILPTGFKGF